MSKNRLEAFSDGVLAIIITIMVLELHVPQGPAFADLGPLVPTILSYLLSFTFVGIYWNNHHHTFQAVHAVTGTILWANLHLLFWLSLIPLTTNWMGKNYSSAVPVAVYGFDLLMSSFAYWILIQALVKHHGKDSKIAKAIGNDRKGKLSVILYLVAVPLAFVSTWGSLAIYVVVALLWLIPDTRIEKLLTKTSEINP